MNSVVELALKMKAGPGSYSHALEQKTLAMVFEKPSTRTRLSFEAGMTKLGGHAIFVDARTTQLSLGSLPEEAGCISRYSDAIMVRPMKHATVAEIARCSRVPVINGLSESDHPCQALADILTIREKKGRLKGVKVAYLGIANNVSNSLALACVKTGMHFTLCVPEKDPDADDPAMLKQAEETGIYTEEPDIAKAVKGADILYTDTWVNMEFFKDPKFAAEKARREKALMPYQLNRKALELAGPQALSMHDLPAHIGCEIDEYALRGPRSVALDQAENRMWAQMALLVKMVGGKK
jgi:ornithine carbamoyltransferase